MAINIFLSHNKFTSAGLLLNRTASFRIRIVLMILRIVDPLDSPARFRISRKGRGYKLGHLPRPFTSFGTSPARSR